MMFVAGETAEEGGKYVVCPNPQELYGNAQHVEMNDEWEMFNLRFTVFYPQEDPNEEIFMDIEQD